MSEIVALEMPSQMPKREHLGHATLARWAASELRGAARDTAAAHIEGCAQCQARLKEMEAQRRAFLVQRPTSRFLADLEARRPKPWLRRWAPSFGGLLLAAAAALWFVVLAPNPGPTTPGVLPDVHHTRIKSGVGLSFHVRTVDGIHEGQPGGVYHPGDAIQLRYTSPGPVHLLVVSLDSSGAVTPFYDAQGRSLTIEPGTAQLLEGSVVLDDTLGAERVIGCFSREPLSTQAVIEAGEAALKAAGGDPKAVERLDLDCIQTGFTILKRASQ